MFKDIIAYLSMPYKFKFFKQFMGTECNILDVGCGNHSPLKTKQYFKHCIYHGVDKEKYNLDDIDTKIMDNFFKIDLDKNLKKIALIKNNYYDIIIVSHVIEHLHNGIEVIKNLISKIKPGGLIYVEYPRMKTVHFPSMKGTLNFYDDPTHVKLYTINEIKNILIKNKLHIIKYGVRRDKVRIVLSPILIFYTRLRYKSFLAYTFWDLLGFSEFIVAMKQAL